MCARTTAYSSADEYPNILFIRDGYLMKPSLHSWHQETSSLFSGNEGHAKHSRFLMFLACVALISAAAACSPKSSSENKGAQPSPAAQSAPVVQSQSQSAPVSDPTVSANQDQATLREIELAGNDSKRLARYVFERHGCSSCHTLTTDGKFGFTDTGRLVGRHFEGCISLLTSMNVIALRNPADWTAGQRDKATLFKEFGCVECHQIKPGKLGLTPLGAKLLSLHMACTDVQKILNQK
jgi:cytochrome c551/c552